MVPLTCKDSSIEEEPSATVMAFTARIDAFFHLPLHSPIIDSKIRGPERASRPA